MRSFGHVFRLMEQCQILSAGGDIEGRRLCFVELAKLHEFDLQIDAARGRFREAAALPPGKSHSRVLREFASFEKRQGKLEVCCLSVNSSLQRRILLEQVAALPPCSPLQISQPAIAALEREVASMELKISSYKDCLRFNSPCKCAYICGGSV